MAAGIAHEVRNPLNALQINVQILEQELAEHVADRSAHVYTVLGSIAGELRHLEGFVSEFLRFARPPKLKLERVPVRPLLTDLATFIAPQCQSRKVSLILALDRGPSSVVADSFQLKHAVLNLVLNALQATGPGGRIVLGTDGDAERLRIEVTDTGEGIADEIRERIFGLFFTTREGGTGLGLPIASRIAQDHGGHIEIDSHPRAGTRAAIVVPLRCGP